MTGLAFLLALAGFAALATAMERHARDLLGRVPLRSTVRARRVAGAAALALAYALTVGAWGGAVGTVLWCGLISLAATAVMLAVSRMTVRKARRR